MPNDLSIDDDRYGWRRRFERLKNEYSMHYNALRGVGGVRERGIQLRDDIDAHPEGTAGDVTEIQNAINLLDAKILA